MVDVLKSLDSKNEGTVGFEQAANGFAAVGIKLSHHELYTLVVAFDKNNNFTLSMEQ